MKSLQPSEEDDEAYARRLQEALNLEKEMGGSKNEGVDKGSEDLQVLDDEALARKIFRASLMEFKKGCLPPNSSLHNFFKEILKRKQHGESTVDDESLLAHRMLKESLADFKTPNSSNSSLRDFFKDMSLRKVQDECTDADEALALKMYKESLAKFKTPNCSLRDFFKDMSLRKLQGAQDECTDDDEALALKMYKESLANFKMSFKDSLTAVKSSEEKDKINLKKGSSLSFDEYMFEGCLEDLALRPVEDSARSA